MRRAPPREVTTVNPYPGPRPFTEDDARFYFGRHPDLLDLQRRSGADTRWIHIDGEPGVGVSSFVHAAIVPAIRRGAFPVGGPHVRVVTWQVDKHGIAGLHLALATAMDSPELVNAIAEQGASRSPTW